MPKITHNQWMDALFDLYMTETKRKSVSDDSPEFINWLHRKTVDELELLLEKLEKQNGKAPQKTTTAATS